MWLGYYNSEYIDVRLRSDNKTITAVIDCYSNGHIGIDRCNWSIRLYRITPVK